MKRVAALCITLLCLVVLTYAQKPSPTTDLRVAASKGDWTTVEVLATKALKSNRNDRLASLLLSMSQLRQGKNQEALRSAHRTIALDSSMMQAWLLASECEAQLNHANASISLLLAAQKRFPDSLQPTWALGMAYTKAGRCAEAIMPLEETMFRRPELVGVMQQLAHCYFITGQLNESAELYERVVDRDPQNIPNRLAYGEVLLARRDLDKAAAQFRNVIEREPRQTNAYLALTSILQEQNKTDEALAISRRLTIIDPNDAMGWFNVGLLSQALKQTDSSVRAFKRAIAIRPNYSEAYFNLALAYEEKGFGEDAIQSFKRCASLNPLLAPDAYNSLAIIYRKEGRFDEAVATHAQAIALRDTSAVLHASRINTYFDAERCMDASKLLVATRERFPDSPDVLYACARCMLRNGERKEVEMIVAKLDVISPQLASELRRMMNL